MSLFKNESPVLSRNAQIVSDVPNQSGGTSEPRTFNMIPTEYLVTVPLAASSVSSAFFIADDYYQVAAVKEVHSVVGGAAAAVNVEHLTGTQAPGGGTAVLTGTISCTSTINTVQNGTLSSTTSTLQLAPGDRLGIVMSGTLTGLVGSLTIALKRWQ